MRKFIHSMLCSIALFAVNAHADNESAHLVIKIASTKQDNTYFLYVEDVGCVSLQAANHGKIFPLTPGHIDHLLLVNSGTMQVYPQPIPKSCDVLVKSKQTLIIKGKIVEKNDKVYVNKLTCSVA